VDGKVNPAVYQGLLDFFDKKALAPDLGQRDIAYFVPAGFDHLKRYTEVRIQVFQLGFDPIGLPQGKLAAAGADSERFYAHTPQLAQEEDEQPLQAEPAEALTDSPPFPLLTNPQAERSRLTVPEPQSGQSAFSSPRIRASNFFSHFSQTYSCMGMMVSPYYKA